MVLKNEEKEIYDIIIAARKIQDFLWGYANDNWTIDEWKKMFKKRIQKIDDIDIENPHAITELKKRLLQNAALSVKLLNIIRNCETSNKNDEYI